MTAPLPVPLDLAPTVLEWLTVEQRIALWAEVMDASEELLLAGLRRQVGPDGDLITAYRHWYAEHRKEHERGLFRMLDRLGNSERNHEGREAAPGCVE